MIKKYKKMLDILSVLIIIVVIIYYIYLNFKGIDMTEGRKFIEFWKEYLIGSILLIVCSFNIGGLKK